jgi:16S rRNA (uracil1498-N3)-methyltransferase
MRLNRVYVPAPLRCGAQITLPPQASEHVARVLRFVVGDTLTLFDGAGGEYDATIEAIGKTGVRALVGEHRPRECESTAGIVLLQALLRSEKMDWIVQKATELGVTEIVPVAAERSVVRLDADQATKRREHWLAVAASACEQSGRNRLPRIAAPMPLHAAVAARAAEEYKLVFDTGATESLATRLGPTNNSVALLIGPEGGWTDTELVLANRGGFASVRFGPRILRTETAAIAALAVLQHRLGDL